MAQVGCDHPEYDTRRIFLVLEIELFLSKMAEGEYITPFVQACNGIELIVQPVSEYAFPLWRFSIVSQAYAVIIVVGYLKEGNTDEIKQGVQWPAQLSTKHNTAYDTNETEYNP